MADTQRKRPGTLLGAGILLIIFGVYSLFGNCCGGVTLLMPEIFDNMMAGLAPPGQKQPDPMEGPKRAAKEAPAYFAIGATHTLLGLALGVTALFAGTAVLQMKPVGRTLGLTVAFTEIVIMILHSIYNLVYVVPVLMRVVDEQAQMRPPGMPDLSGIQKATSYGAIVIGLLFQIVIWTIVIMLLRSRSATDAFAGKFEPAEPEAVERPRSRYEGYDDDDPGLPPPLPKSPGDTNITDRP